LTALQDYEIESGKPSGALKIKEVPEIIVKGKSESFGKRK
jgi:hypothetical protein